MRKILSAVVVAATLLITSNVSAQNKMTPLVDTSTNATTRYLSTPVLVNSNGNMVFQYVGTKVSGTVGGVIKLQGSLDGVNYFDETDSLSLANVTTNTKIWDISGKTRTIWRLKVTTTGTMVMTNKGYFAAKKP